MKDRNQLSNRHLKFLLILDGKISEIINTNNSRPYGYKGAGVYGKGGGPTKDNLGQSPPIFTESISFLSNCIIKIQKLFLYIFVGKTSKMININTSSNYSYKDNAARENAVKIQGKAIFGKDQSIFYKKILSGVLTILLIILKFTGAAILTAAMFTGLWGCRPPVSAGKPHVEISDPDNPGVIDDPTIQDPNDPGIDDPNIQDPTDPGIDEPGIDDPGIDDPGIDDPGTDEPGIDEPTIPDPDDPGIDEPTIPDPDDPGIDEPEPGLTDEEIRAWIEADFQNCILLHAELHNNEARETHKGEGQAAIGRATAENHRLCLEDHVHVIEESSDKDIAFYGETTSSAAELGKVTAGRLTGIVIEPRSVQRVIKDGKPSSYGFVRMDTGPPAKEWTVEFQSEPEYEK